MLEQILDSQFMRPPPVPREMGSVRGYPISHFCCSRFHYTSRLELCSAPISKLHSTLKSELCSTFTSGVTVDVKWLVYVHPGSVRGPHNAGSVRTEQ